MITAYFSALLATIRRNGWLPCTVLLIHEFSAHVIDGYRLWPPLDIPLHFFGGFAIAFFASGGIRVFAERELIQQPHCLIQLSFMFALACTAAVFWEFAEWTTDHTLGTRCQLGLDDTMLDLLMGVAGGATCTGVTAIKMLKKSSGQPN